MEKFVKSIKRKYQEKVLQHEEQCVPFSGDKLLKLELIQVEKKEGFMGRSRQNKNVIDENQLRMLQVFVENRSIPHEEVGLQHNAILHSNAILHNDLFSPDNKDNKKKRVRKVIIEGNAGTGKTTLCTMLTEEWAEGKILTQFDRVLLLPLRERSVSTVTSLDELIKLFHSSEKIRSSMIEELEEREGEGVLIIADGWDELDSKNRKKGSFLYELLFGSILSFVSVLLTSRPTSSAHFHNLPFVDRFVEVLGFNEENIKQYIESEFEKCPEKASSLIEQLENNPMIQSVCSVPLNCAIICNLWHTLDEMLPNTLTELYTQIILNVILRDIKKKGSTLLSLKNFDSIPEHLQEIFWLICKFACESLLSDQIVFSKDEVSSFFPDSQDLFGLLQVAQSLLPVGQGLSFHFAHLTIQEFLAALHLVIQPTEETLKAFEVYAIDSRFTNVWPFFFGLGYNQSSCSKKIVCLDTEMVDKFMSAQVRNHPDFASGFQSVPGLLDKFTFVDNKVCFVTSEMDRMDTLLLCHIAFESKNITLTEQLAKRIKGYLRTSVIKSIAKNPHDYAAVLYVFKHVLQCFGGEIIMTGCGLTDKQLRELTKILSSKSDSLQFTKVDLSFNKLTDKGASDLFIKASASFRSLECISLRCNKITDIMASSFSYASFRSLIELNLAFNFLGVLGAQSLERAIQAGILANLESLNFVNTLTNDSDINGALLVTLLSSIASHCPKLSHLELGEEDLCFPGACALAEATPLLCVNRKQIVILLVVDDETVTAFCNFLSLSTRKYPVLSLTKNCSLHLENNGLGYDTLLAIFRMLKNENCPITELCLSGNDLTSLCFGGNGLAQLARVARTKSQLSELKYTFMILNLPLFHSNYCLTNLSIDNNDFSGKNAHILTECLSSCQSLEYLSSSDCCLSSKEINTLLCHLISANRTFKSLKSWNLSKNLIDDDGIAFFRECQPRLFCNLEIRDIDFADNLSNEDDYSNSSQEKINRIPLFSRNVTGILMETKVDTHCLRAMELTEVLEKRQAEFSRKWDELLWELFYFMNSAFKYPHHFGLSCDHEETQFFPQAKRSEHSLEGSRIEQQNTNDEDSPNRLIGRVSVAITNIPHNYDWKDYGFNLTIPENSLPPEIDKCVLHIDASLPAPCEIPEDYKLVSAVYKVRCEPEVEFKRNLTVRIQHSASLNSIAELTFARATDQARSCFTVLRSGEFSVDECYGSLQLTQFSRFAILINTFRQRLLGVEHRYCAMLFYQVHSAHKVDIELPVCHDLLAHMKVVKNYYENERNFESGPQTSVRLGTHVELEIEPNYSSEAEKHWDVISFTAQHLDKAKIDYWSEGHDSQSGSGLIPAFQLQATFNDSTISACDLSRRLILNSALGERSWLQIFISSNTLNRNRVKTVTIEELKTRTKVTDSQLRSEIEETDMILLAPHFNNVEIFPVLLGLNPAEQQDVKYALYLNNMQTAMFLALRLWRRANPDAATYRALVEIVLRMGANGTAIAEEVCKFSAQNHHDENTSTPAAEKDDHRSTEPPQVMKY